MEYARPQPFFAYRVVRAMTKTCATHDIGLDGFALVALIVHQWDAIRYARPVSYHLATLMNLLGVSSKQRLSRIEKACIAKGWLARKNQGTRLPVLYWVLLPPHAMEAGDGPTVDGIGFNPVPNTGTNPGTNTVSESTLKPDRNRADDRTQTGPPSTLSLSLTPIPNPNAGDREPDPASVFDGTPSAGPPDPEQHWPYVRRQPWVAALQKAGAGINKTSWIRWDGIRQRFTEAAVLGVVQSLPSCDRNPWTVEAALEELARKKPPETKPSNAITPEHQIGVILKHGGGWKNVCKLAALDFEVTGEEMLRDILGEDYRTRNELYAKATA